MVFGFLTEPKYSYYNAPEGEDPIGKIIGLGKYGFALGSFCGIYDAIMYSHCANLPQFMNTWGHWVVPLTGMCVAFTGVVYTLRHVRNKDDKVNYLAGALTSGSILYAWQKCPRIAGWGTAAMVLYALAKKQSIQEGLSRNMFLTEPDWELQRKRYFPWRTLPHRNYTSAPRYPHDKEDYYINHY